MLRILTTVAGLCFTILSFNLQAEASGQPASQPQGPHSQLILILGDSISAGYGLSKAQGWVNLLSQSLQQAYPGTAVINASISGETTAGGLARLPRLLERYKPDIVIIELGGNDGLGGFPIRIVYDNLHAMISQSLAAQAKVIVTQIQIPPNYGHRYSDAFTGVYRQLQQQLDIILVENFLQRVALDPDLMQDDGIHPNEQGQPLLLQEIEKYLYPLLATPGAQGNSPRTGQVKAEESLSDGLQLRNQAWTNSSVRLCGSGGKGFKFPFQSIAICNQGIHQSVECSAVIKFHQMTQFMNDHIFDQRWG